MRRRKQQVRGKWGRRVAIPQPLRDALRDVIDNHLSSPQTAQMITDVDGVHPNAGFLMALARGRFERCGQNLQHGIQELAVKVSPNPWAAQVRAGALGPTRRETFLLLKKREAEQKQAEEEQQLQAKEEQQKQAKEEQQKQAEEEQLREDSLRWRRKPAQESPQPDETKRTSLPCENERFDRMVTAFEGLHPEEQEMIATLSERLSATSALREAAKLMIL